MADNTTLNPGSGGDTFAADDIGGIKHPRTKIEFGVDGAAVDTSASNPLPVILTGTQAATPVTDNAGSLTVDDGGGSLTVDGAVSVSGAVDTELTTADLDTGAGTDTRGVVGLVRAESGGGTLVGSANPLPVTGPLTDTQLRASAVPVSGTFFQATQPVSGTVTANAGTGPFPVSDNAGSLTVDAPVGTPVFVRLSDGTSAIATLPVSGPLTDTQLRASAVPVTGPLTDTQLRATPVPVSGTVTADTELPAAAALADATANPTVPLAGSPALLFNGTTWDRVRGDITNGVDVDVTRLPALPTGANTIGKVDQGAPAVVANAWPVKLTDGTNSPAVKAASTPAVAADPALVVAISPGTPVVIKEDQPAATTATWTSATGVNTAATATVTNYAAASISIQTPTTVTAGIITLEVSDDAGTTYYPAGTVRIENGQQENIVTLALTPGIVLNRSYQVGLQGFTNLRARLSTVIVGAGNTLVRISPTGAPAEPLVATRSRKSATYRAVYRATARPYSLSNVFVANTRKQYATIHHAAAAVRTVRVRRVLFALIANTVGANISVDLVRVTAAPATGNPAITPSKADSSVAAVEATCLALPTTAGTEEAQPLASLRFNLGATGAASVISPPPVMQWLELYSGSVGDDEGQLAVVRAGVLEGWAVTVDADAASTITAEVQIEFTEEAP